MPVFGMTYVCAGVRAPAGRAARLGDGSAGRRDSPRVGARMDVRPGDDASCSAARGAPLSAARPLAEERGHVSARNTVLYAGSIQPP